MATRQSTIRELTVVCPVGTLPEIYVPCSLLLILVGFAFRSCDELFVRAHFLPLITFGTCRSLWIPYNIRGQYIMPFPTYLKYYKMNPACVCFVNIEDFFLGSPQSVSPPRPSKHSERRRRSQRLATLPMPDDSGEKVSPPSPATDGKVFSISAQSQQATSVPEGNVY